MDGKTDLRKAFEQFTEAPEGKNWLDSMMKYLGEWVEDKEKEVTRDD